MKSRLCDIEHYSGPLREQMRQFVRQKRALGLKYDSEAYYLGTFDRFLNETDAPQNTLLKESVIQFGAKKANEAHKSFSNRGTVLRQFGEYMATMGYNSYILPYFEMHISSFVPYIFTKDEMKHIFAEVDKREYTTRSKHSHLIYPLVFRILYGCGMRINEAVNLKVCDIDFQNAVFKLTDTKWNGERLVPMSNSLLEECRYYFNNVHLAGEYEYFFPSIKGGALSDDVVRTEFKRILAICGITSAARIHDLRHTFSVHLLNQWAERGEDIYVCLPLLSKYLGHKKVSATEDYLRLTAEVFPEVSKTFEQKYRGVIPEVKTFGNGC